MRTESTINVGWEVGMGRPSTKPGKARLACLQVLTEADRPLQLLEVISLGWGEGSKGEYRSRVDLEEGVRYALRGLVHQRLVAAVDIPGGRYEYAITPAGRLAVLILAGGPSPGPFGGTWESLEQGASDSLYSLMTRSGHLLDVLARMIHSRDPEELSAASRSERLDELAVIMRCLEVAKQND